MWESETRVFHLKSWMKMNARWPMGQIMRFCVQNRRKRESGRRGGFEVRAIEWKWITQFGFGLGWKVKTGWKGSVEKPKWRRCKEMVLMSCSSQITPLGWMCRVRGYLSTALPCQPACIHKTINHYHWSSLTEPVCIPKYVNFACLREQYNRGSFTHVHVSGK